jgi:hypothetical protein
MKPDKSRNRLAIGFSGTIDHPTSVGDSANPALGLPERRAQEFDLSFHVGVIAQHPIGEPQRQAVYHHKPSQLPHARGHVKWLFECAPSITPLAPMCVGPRAHFVIQQLSCCDVGARADVVYVIERESRFFRYEPLP